jgi:hypothetical protein
MADDFVVTQTIFLVTASWGEFEDRGHCNKGVAFEREDAEKMVNQLYAKQQKCNDAIKLIKAQREKIDAELGPVEYENTPDYPRWPAGIGKAQITQAMMDERTKIKLLTQQINARNKARQGARFEVQMAAQKKLALSLGYHETHKLCTDGYLYKKEVHYGIEEVPVFKIRD